MPRQRDRVPAGKQCLPSVEAGRIRSLAPHLAEASVFSPALQPAERSVTAMETKSPQPTPEQWWSTVPDEKKPAYRAAAETGVLPPDLAQEMQQAGVLLVWGAGFVNAPDGGNSGTADFPQEYADYALEN